MIPDRSISTWEYVDDRLVPSLADWRASLFSVGNGYLGTRGTFEEGFGSQERATFIHGLFVTPPNDLPVLGAAPDWSSVALVIDGQPVRLDLQPPAGFERRLDMRTGVTTRTFVWKGAETGAIRATFRRTASMAHPDLVALDMKIEALTDPVEVVVETGIDATVEGPYGVLFKADAFEQTGRSSLELTSSSVDGVHTLATRCWVGGLDEPELIPDPDHPRIKGAVTVEPARPWTLTKLAHYEHPAAEPVGRSFEEMTFDDVVAASAPHWESRWKTSRIDIAGDPEAERAARFAAFHLIAAAPPTDTAGSIGARLLSGYGYRHHVFWDTDIYVVPYLTLTQPDLALVHLRYRHRGLPGARKKAAGFGHTGAFYAWEAADTGDEVTPMWGHMSDGDPIRIWTGELEEHITGCVAWATDHYHRWTGDDGFMATMGAEMILDGARHWASRFDREADGAHLRNVIGPNEYHVHVNDNFFTNSLARWQLGRAVKAADWLAERNPQGAETLLAALDLDSTHLEDFTELANQIVVNQNEDGVYEEREGFFDLESIAVASFQPSRASLHEILGDKRTQEVQLIKQADVLMAAVVLGDTLEGDVLAANFDYYAPKTDHGSSLSLAMHALAAAKLGRTELGYDYLRRAVAIDHNDAMVRGGQGIHAAAQGGVLQAIISGFGGLGLSDGRPATSPSLPDHWESLGFTYLFHGETRDVLLDQNSRPEDGRRSG